MVSALLPQTSTQRGRLAGKVREGDSEEYMGSERLSKNEQATGWYSLSGKLSTRILAFEKVKACS